MKPLYGRTRDKIQNSAVLPVEPESVRQLQNAWIELLRLEADLLNDQLALNESEANARVSALMSFLTGTNFVAPSDLISLVASTYEEKGSWPPAALGGGTNLAANSAIRSGLEKLRATWTRGQTEVAEDLESFKQIVQGLVAYQTAELEWLGKADRTLDSLAVQRSLVLSNWSSVSSGGTLSNRIARLADQSINY